MEHPPSKNEGDDRPPSPVSALPIGSVRIKDKAGNEPETENDKGSFADDSEDGGTSDNEEQEDDQKPTSTVRSLVASTLERERRQNAKHHRKRGTTKVGRAKGHKGKMNNRVKADSSGMWD